MSTKYPSAATVTASHAARSADIFDAITSRILEWRLRRCFGQVRAAHADFLEGLRGADHVCAGRPVLAVDLRRELATAFDAGAGAHDLLVLRRDGSALALHVCVPRRRRRCAAGDGL